MTEYNFTVPAPGEYHVVSGGARPHLTSKCGPQCYLGGGLPKSTMTITEVVTFPNTDGLSIGQKIDAAPRLVPFAVQGYSFDYPAEGNSRLADSLTGEVGPNPHEGADRQHGYPEEGH